MPPITSPRRTALHAHAAPVPIPVPGGMAGLPGMGMGLPALSGASTSTFASTPPSTGTSPGSASLGSVGAAASSSMGRAHSQTHMPNPHPHHNVGTHPHSAPYMVALAGWPEPVFVAEAWDTRKRSRPASPVGSRDVRDGVACPPPAALVNSLPGGGVGGGVTASPNPNDGASSGGSAGSRSPAYPRAAPGMARTPSGGVLEGVPGLRSRGGSPPGFPMSAARDAPGPRPGSSGNATPTASSSGSTPPAHSHMRPGSRDGGGVDTHAPLSGTLARLALADRPPKTGGSPSLAARTVRRNMEKFGFADPRYALNAAVIGRAGRGPLRVAPAWTSAAAGAGAPYHPHERDSIPSLRGRPTSATRTGVARAAPEVYPPTKAPFVTQVYPRDPDRPFFVRTPGAPVPPAAARPRHANGSRSGTASPTADDGEPAPKAARIAATEAARRSASVESDSAAGAVNGAAGVAGVPSASATGKPAAARMDVDA